jgi:hypothetical protein
MGVVGRTLCLYFGALCVARGESVSGETNGTACEATTDSAKCASIVIDEEEEVEEEKMAEMDDAVMDSDDAEMEEFTWASPCAQKFGARYTLHAHGSDAPKLTGGALEMTVSYLTSCPGGGSTFEVGEKEKGTLKVLFASRAEPECPGEALPFEKEWRGRVTAAVEPEMVAKYLAFPPESDFDLWHLR